MNEQPYANREIDEKFKDGKEYVEMLQMAYDILTEKFSPQFIDLAALTAERDGLIVQVAELQKPDEAKTP